MSEIHILGIGTSCKGQGFVRYLVNLDREVHESVFGDSKVHSMIDIVRNIV